MTHRPNPVQSIAQHRQQFSQQSRQPIQSLGQPQQPVVGAEQQIQQQMHELAMEIFARLVAGKCLDDSYSEPLDPSHLRQLATNSQAAARAYFEQLGVTFNEEQTNGQS